MRSVPPAACRLSRRCAASLEAFAISPGWRIQYMCLGVRLAESLPVTDS